MFTVDQEDPKIKYSSLFERFVANVPYLCRWAAINIDKGIIITSNVLEEIQGYTIGFAFGHGRIQIEFADYLIRVHGANFNWTLP